MIPYVIGAGKKTRVMALLREIYGAGAEKVKLEHRSLKTPSNKTIDITTLGSNYHIECNPSDAGNNDRFVVQEVIKEIASHGVLQAGSTQASKGFKVVVLTEADRLSKQAQASLRRTMEKYVRHMVCCAYQCVGLICLSHSFLFRYSSICRIILICDTPSKIIDPVRSRCLGIRVPAPSNDDIADILSDISKNENIVCPRDFAMRISMQSEKNIRRALLMLEAAKVQHYPLAADQPVVLPDWELYICRISREILQEQSPTKLLQVRDMLYELLTNCIPADVIIRTLTRELCKSLDDSLKHELVHWAAYYEHRIRLGSKEIFHLEAFVAKFMATYKKWLTAMFS